MTRRTPRLLVPTEHREGSTLATYGAPAPFVTPASRSSQAPVFVKHFLTVLLPWALSCSPDAGWRMLTSPQLAGRSPAWRGAKP